MLAGPWCTQLLADLGADVIKIEKPGSGDDTRRWGPPFLKDTSGRDTAESAYYLGCNRGKQSVAVDFTSADGRRIVRDLCKQADIVVENFKVGALTRHGLDYAALAEINPPLIYCSITGFGQTGPYAERAGYDFIIQGIGGFMSVTGERDDQPGGGPQKAGIAVADLMTGMYAVTAILAAVAHRAVSGVGQYIDAALLDTQVAMMASLDMNYLVTGTAPGRAGNAHQNIVPYQVFDCADAPLILAVGNDGQFARFCEVAGTRSWLDDSRFARNSERVRHRDFVVPSIAKVMRGRTQRDWLGSLEAAGVPCGPINRIDEVFADPQVVARGMRVDMPHPLAGTVPQVGNPLKFSSTPIAYTRTPPLLGEHTRDVLLERLGLSDAALLDLAARGVIEMRN